MKVKVIKCPYIHFWYNNHIGETFEAVNYNDTHYRIVGEDMYLNKEDIVVVREEQKEEDNMQNLLLEMCNLSLFERTANEYKEIIERYPVLKRDLEIERNKNKILLERLHQCKKSHRENKCKLMGKIYKILRRCK